MEAGTLDVADFDISIKKGPRRMTTAAPPATVANKTPKNAMIDKILQPPGSHSSSNKRKGLHEKEVRKEKNKYKNIGAKEDEGRERCRADAGASRAIFFPFRRQLRWLAGVCASSHPAPCSLRTRQTSSVDCHLHEKRRRILFSRP